MAFQIIPEYPPGHPAGGCCISCRAPRRLNSFRDTGEHLVDLGFYCDVATDMEGQPAFVEVPAVLCETCARELATMIGYVEPDFVEKKNLEHWRSRAEKAETDLAALDDFKARLAEVIK